MTSRHHCYDFNCQEPATYSLRNLHMCPAHYIEALEHGADLNYDLHNLVCLGPVVYCVIPEEDR